MRIEELRGAGRSKKISWVAIAAHAGVTTKAIQNWNNDTTQNPERETVVLALEFVGFTKAKAEIEYDRIETEYMQAAIPPSESVATFKPLNDAAPTQHQPNLTGPTSEQRESHFSRRLLDVIGRDDEQDKLRRFLLGENGFSWLQIAGEGGQGKSRLGLELITEAKALGWKAGFLKPDHAKRFKDNWDDWQPDERQLIVIDYAVGQGDDIGPMFRALLENADNLRHPVRLLFLERQRWDHGISFDVKSKFTDSTAADGQRTSHQGEADWFKALYGETGGKPSGLYDCAFEKSAMIELTELDDDALFSIVERVAQRGTVPRDLCKDEVITQLQHFDPSGRPLYAYFYGEVLQDGADVTGWSREGLLSEVLVRERKHSKVEIGSNAEKLAVIATMTEGVTWDVLKGIDGLDASRQTYAQALAITHAPVKDGEKLPDMLPPLQPDILGEWFVIEAMEQGLDTHELAQLAWDIDPLGMSRFIIRFVQDFPKQPVSSVLADIKPKTDFACSVYDLLATSMLITFKDAKVEIPPELVCGLQRRANNGDAAEMYNLGVCYDIGDGVAVDEEASWSWYEKAAEAGDANALFNLGTRYANGEGVAVDDEAKWSWYEKAAEAGSVEAMFNLGARYANGDGVAVDHEASWSWYEKAAEAGNATAMFNLGARYANGDGVAVDEAAKWSWLEKAAEAGDATAMFNLGARYENGDGVAVDEAAKWSWYEKAAEAGDATAMFNLGTRYVNGEGVAVDEVAASGWFEKAAEAGDAKAMFNLGVCYSLGEGVAVDEVAASGWYEKAAEAGDAKAMFNLSVRYGQGIGIEQDIDKAKHWMNKAAEAGQEDAVAFLRQIEQAQSDEADDPG